MVNDSSLGGVGSSNAFDFNSEGAVTNLLAAVRASGLSSAEKNELRDLIFLYKNGGQDPAIKITLESKLVKHGIAPVSSASSAVGQPATAHSFGTSRPSPSFPVGMSQAPVSQPVVPPAPQPAPAYVPPAPVMPPAQPMPVPAPAPMPVAPVAAQPVPVAVPVPPPVMPAPAPVVPPAPQPAPAYVPPVPVAAPAPVMPPAQPMPVPAPAPMPVAPVAAQPVPVAVPVPPPVMPAPTPVVPPAPQPAPVAAAPAPAPVAAPVVPPAPTDQAVNLQRIREIKSLVNEKVGNPVNLVNIDNTTGREYMSALLEAMKAINNGSSSVTAMKRLEDAYAMVEQTIATKGTAPKKEPVASEPAVAPAPTPESVPQSASVAEPEQPEAPVQPDVTSKPIVAPSTPVAPAPEKEVVPVVKETEVASAWGPATDTLKPKAPNQLSSLADSKTKLRTPSELPLAEQVETSEVKGDPLFTKEVDSGLQQLLEEWSLFKKSGFFGTGPKGREHPLFKKIAGLQIPLLLAGRFEGATQEIKQSITDYMNGWRYEQGIIYNQGEAFEHYLRRVIKHILDLQKNKRKS